MKEKKENVRWIMRFVLFLFVCSVLSAQDKHDPKYWVSYPPQNLQSIEKRGKPLGREEVFEVTASKFDTAYMLYLYAEPYFAINDSEANSLTGGHYQRSSNKRPYLVRALYLNGGTGGFYVYRLGKAVWVMHGCLGGGEVLSRSALVVNLEHEPTDLYVTAVSAE